MRTLLVCLFNLLIISGLISKTPDWTMPIENKVLKLEVSPDYQKMIIINEGEDNLVLTCLNYQDGKVLWKFELSGLEEGQVDFCRFVDEKIIYACRNNEHVFLSVEKGEVLKTIPLFCEEWDDVLWGKIKNPQFPDMIWETIFENGFAIYFGSDGMQIIDLNKQLQLYKNISDSRTTTLLTQLNYKCFNISSYGIIVLDTKERKIVLDKPNSEITVSSRMKKPIILNEGYGTFVCDDAIKFYNLSTGSHISDYEVDPTDLEYLGAIDVAGQLYMLKSTEESHVLIDIKTGKNLFSTIANSIPGFIEKVIISSDKSYYIVTAYNNDGNTASLYKINSGSMEVLWKKDLFEYNKNFTADFLNQSSASKLMSAVAVMALSNVLSSRSGNWQQQMENRRDMTRFLSNTLNELNIAIYKCDGYANTVYLDNNKITLACSGDIISKLQEIEDENEQEFLTTINLSDGSIIKYDKYKIDDSPAEGDAIKSSKVESMLNGICLFGKMNLYILRGEKIEAFNFGEKELTFHNNAGESLVFSSFDRNENIYDIYKLDVKENESNIILLTETDKKDVLYNDSYLNMPYSIKIDDEFISFFNPINSIVNENNFTSPVHQISTDEFDLGSFDDYPLFTFDGFFNGIRRVDKGFLLAGNDAIGFISDDAKCKWTTEWPSKPFYKTTGINYANGFVTYETDKQVGIIDKDCSGKYVHEQDFKPFSDLYLLLSNKSAVIITSDENIQVFNLK